jgi:uncharacterized protein (DUF885 family)
MVGGLLMLSLTAACGGEKPVSVKGGAGDAAFTKLMSDILEDHYVRNPTQATDLGIHKYDDRLEDDSQAAVASTLQAVRQFKQQVDAIAPAELSGTLQLDREFVSHALASEILALDSVKSWAKDPDTYSSGVTNTAYVMIKRSFAPPEDRLRKLIAREKLMPAALAEARRNLQNPPRIYTEIAIEQIDGNQDLFKTALPLAFASVKDEALLAEFKAANAAVIKAFDEYRTWLETDLLPKSAGSFAYGADLYHQKLIADEMVDTPLDELLRIAEADLKKNQAAFAEAAKALDPSKTPMELLASLQDDHPPAAKLLETTQAELDSLRTFIASHHLVTIPDGAPARVKETPPFLRATTSASMDTPGPFETVAKEAYYNMTLPDPASPAAEQAEFMKQWYYAAISNVSVHEVWPGHYLQFLYAHQFPTDARKVFGANTNIEGWAHYCEQMILDEGFHAGEPKYRLAQLQDALLRDARFIVGIKLHTQGMTIEQAEQFFELEGYQPAPVAKSETKRGTADATYGYYTMGKLMILKLREDYKTQLGAGYTLQGFHDAFIKLGPLQLPLMRKALRGSTGSIF